MDKINFQPTRTLKGVYDTCKFDETWKDCYFVSHGHQYFCQGNYIDVRSHQLMTVWKYRGKRTSVFLIPYDDLKYRYQYD